MPDPSTPQDRAAFYEVPGSRLREMRDAAADLDTAIRLLEQALHLRVNGERAPGGTENWPDWDRKAEKFLRGLLEPEREPIPWSPAEAEAIRRSRAADERTERRRAFRAGVRADAAEVGKSAATGDAP